MSLTFSFYKIFSHFIFFGTEIFLVMKSSQLPIRESERKNEREEQEGGTRERERESIEIDD
jgi:hypothetical protein